MRRTALLGLAVQLLVGVAASAAEQSDQPSPGTARLLFPAALLQASEKGEVPLLAEVGTWMGRLSVKASCLEGSADDAMKAFKGLGGPSDYQLREEDGWVLARSEQWYWTPRRDCDATTLLRIYREGGITPASVPGIGAMSQLQRRTLRDWLGRRTPSRPEPPCPELLDIEDDQAVSALQLWATLAPGQLEAAVTGGLRAADLLPTQAAMLSRLLWKSGGVRWSAESSSDVVVRLGPRVMTRWSKYSPDTPEPPGSAEGATVALTLRGWSEEQALEVALPIADTATMEARRGEAKTSKSFLGAEFGRMRSLWPREEEQTGLTTPFDFRCAIVRVKDVLLHISRECGVHLKADHWAGRRYLVANFKKRTVEDFRTALVELLDCKWRYDEEGEYWLLYQDEEARKEEARLIAEQEEKERMKWEERIADNPMAGVVEDLLKELEPDTAERIRAGLSVDVPLDKVRRGLWATIGECALFDASGRQAVSTTGWEPMVDEVTGGWLEFRPSRFRDHVDVYGVLTLQKSPGGGHGRLRRNLGAVLLLQ